MSSLKSFSKMSKKNYYDDNKVGAVSLPNVEKRNSKEQKKLGENDVAVFIQRAGFSSITEIRKVAVDEEGFGSVPELPRTINGSSLFCIESISDPNAYISSHDFESKSEETLKLSPFNREKPPLPSVGFHLRTEKKGEEHLLELNYQTSSGLSYTTEYVGIIDPTGSYLNFHGHYSVLNHTGKTFKNAHIFLVVETKKPKPAPAAVTPSSNNNKASNSANSRGNRRGSYEKNNANVPSSNIKTLGSQKIPKQVTLKEDSVTHIRFANAKVPIEVFNLIYSAPFEDKAEEANIEREYSGPAMVSADRVLSFGNTIENHLGMALPMGTFTVSRKEADGFGLIHGDPVRIPRQAPNSTVFIKLGSLSRVQSTRKVVRFEHNKLEGKLVETIELTLSNETGEDVEVTIIEQAYRSPVFELVNSNDWVKLKEDRQLQTKMTVLASSKAVTSYTVQYSVPAEVSPNSKAEENPIASKERTSSFSISKSGSNTGEKKKKGFFG